MLDCVHYHYKKIVAICLTVLLEFVTCMEYETHPL